MTSERNHRGEKFAWSGDDESWLMRQSSSLTNIFVRLLLLRENAQAAFDDASCPAVNFLVAVGVPSDAGLYGLEMRDSLEIIFFINVAALFLLVQIFAPLIVFYFNTFKQNWRASKEAALDCSNHADALATHLLDDFRDVVDDKLSVLQERSHEYVFRICGSACCVVDSKLITESEGNCSNGNRMFDR